MECTGLNLSELYSYLRKSENLKMKPSERASKLAEATGDKAFYRLSYMLENMNDIVNFSEKIADLIGLTSSSKYHVIVSGECYLPRAVLFSYFKGKKSIWSIKDTGIVCSKFKTTKLEFIPHGDVELVNDEEDIAKLKLDQYPVEDFDEWCYGSLNTTECISSKEFWESK